VWKYTGLSGFNEEVLGPMKPAEQGYTIPTTLVYKKEDILVIRIT
jgi:hypothetical protein